MQTTIRGLLLTFAATIGATVAAAGEPSTESTTGALAVDEGSKSAAVDPDAIPTDLTAFATMAFSCPDFVLYPSSPQSWWLFRDCATGGGKGGWYSGSPKDCKNGNCVDEAQPAPCYPQRAVQPYFNTRREERRYYRRLRKGKSVGHVMYTSPVVPVAPSVAMLTGPPPKPGEIPWFKNPTAGKLKNYFDPFDNSLKNHRDYVLAGEEYNFFVKSAVAGNADLTIQCIKVKVTIKSNLEEVECWFPMEVLVKPAHQKEFEKAAEPRIENGVYSGGGGGSPRFVDFDHDGEHFQVLVDPAH